MKNFAALLFGLCIAHFQVANAEVKVLHKSIGYEENKLVFGLETYVDQRLTYAICDSNPLASEIKCTVIREKEAYADDTYSCNVTLKRRVEPDVESRPHVSIIPFGKHYAALNLFDLDREKTHLHFFTLNFESCEVVEAIIDTKIPLYMPFAAFAVLGHSDSYDVFLYSDNTTYDGKSGKITIGADGKVVCGPSPSTVSLPITSDIAMHRFVSLDDSSSTPRYFHLEENKNEVSQILIQPDGTKKILAVHPKSLVLQSMSTANNLIGVCYQTKSDYNCSQYDFEGNLKLQAKIPRNFEDGILLFDIHNSANGGFYVFSGDCKSGSNPDCRNMRFLIERIHANGTKAGPINFKKFNTVENYHEIKLLLSYENEINETCLSLAFPVFEDNKYSLNLTANCFTDADFAK